MHEFISGLINSDYAVVGLFLLAFAESSFFPIPPDAMMIPMAVLNPAMALVYAAITTLGSVLGGIFGYFIGIKGGKPVVKRFISANKLKLVQDYYHKYDVWAVSLAAFTPIPYKVFTIAAGLFDLHLWRFIIASALGRGGRFFIIGGLIYVFGPTIKLFLDKYLNLAIIGLTILLVGGFWFINYISKKHGQADKTDK